MFSGVKDKPLTPTIQSHAEDVGGGTYTKVRDQGLGIDPPYSDRGPDETPGMKSRRDGEGHCPTPRTGHRKDGENAHPLGLAPVAGPSRCLRSP